MAKPARGALTALFMISCGGANPSPVPKQPEPPHVANLPADAGSSPDAPIVEAITAIPDIAALLPPVTPPTSGLSVEPFAPCSKAAFKASSKPFDNARGTAVGGLAVFVSTVEGDPKAKTRTASRIVIVDPCRGTTFEGDWSTDIYDSVAAGRSFVQVGATRTSVIDTITTKVRAFGGFPHAALVAKGQCPSFSLLAGDTHVLALCDGGPAAVLELASGTWTSPALGAITGVFTAFGAAWNGRVYLSMAGLPGEGFTLDTATMKVTRLERRGEPASPEPRVIALGSRFFLAFGGYAGGGYRQVPSGDWRSEGAIWDTVTATWLPVPKTREALQLRRIEGDVALFAKYELGHATSYAARGYDFRTRESLRYDTLFDTAAVSPHVMRRADRAFVGIEIPALQDPYAASVITPRGLVAFGALPAIEWETLPCSPPQRTGEGLQGCTPIPQAKPRKASPSGIVLPLTLKTGSDAVRAATLTPSL